MGMVGGEIGCLMLIFVLVAVFGGLWLDRLFGTKPLFTILLVLGSAPLSIVITYWIAIRAVRDVNPPPSAGKPVQSVNEEETGE
jgi:F0F1-type ATP synthase assembly protein I